MQRVIVVIGSSWVGKSSLTNKIAKDGGYIRISFGDILREFIFTNLLDNEHKLSNLLSLEKELRDAFGKIQVYDNQFHLINQEDLSGIKSKEFDLLSVISRLGLFFPIYERVILQLIKDQSFQRPIVVDGRDKAIELTLAMGLKPFFVLLTCPTETKVRWQVRRSGLELTEDNLQRFRQKLRERDLADEIHAPSIDVGAFSHLILDTSSMSLEEECVAVLSQSEQFFQGSQTNNTGAKHEDSNCDQ